MPSYLEEYPRAAALVERKIGGLVRLTGIERCLTFAIDEGHYASVEDALKELEELQTLRENMRKLIEGITR